MFLSVLKANLKHSIQRGVLMVHKVTEFHKEFKGFARSNGVLHEVMVS